MRLGIISDVHGNIQALRAVITALAEQAVDEVYCLGDTVGYGGSPEACVQAVRELVRGAVLGNDDAAVAGLVDYSFYHEGAREAVDVHSRALSGSSVKWLQSLPHSLRPDGLDVAFTHGSPRDPAAFEYVLMKEQARHCLPLYDELARVTFMGHNHVFKVFELSPGRGEELPAQDRVLEDGKKYIISVGSVGQPRDYDTRAGYVVYDTEKESVAFQRVAYDIDGAATDIVRAGIAMDFAHRLFVAI